MRSTRKTSKTRMTALTLLPLTRTESEQRKQQPRRSRCESMNKNECSQITKLLRPIETRLSKRSRITTQNKPKSRTSPRPKTAQEGLRFLAKWFDAKYEDSGTGTDTVQQDLRRWADDIDTKELRIKSAANLITNVAQILNVVQSEWGAEGQWSEWDQGVRDSITAWLSEYHGKSLPCSEPEPQTVHTDPARRIIRIRGQA